MIPPHVLQTFFVLLALVLFVLAANQHMEIPNKLLCLGLAALTMAALIQVLH